MARLKVVNPVARPREQKVEPAQRLSDLGGKTLGMYWNMKAGGDVALERTTELLKQRYPGLEVKHYVGSVGQAMRHATAEDVDLVARECQGVVATTGD